MEGILVGLAAAAIGLAIQYRFLRTRGSIVRANEQAYQFHKLRDRLQELELAGLIHRESPTHAFLMSMLNLSIRNAGSIKLRDMVALAKLIEKRVDSTQFEQLAADIRRHDPQVQALASEFFRSFGGMLISNDSLAYWIAKLLMEGASQFRRILPDIVLGFAKTIIIAFSPTRAEAAREAKKYTEWGNKIAQGCA